MKLNGIPAFLTTLVLVQAINLAICTQSIFGQSSDGAATSAGDAPARGASNPPVVETPQAVPTEKPKPLGGPWRSHASAVVREPYIALTFDDGPVPEQTPRLLDMLKERGIKATFYVVGTNAAAHPEILRRMIAEGHEIGSHSWSHPVLSKLSLAEVKSQLDQTSAAIFAAVGENPKTIRPPYGATSAMLNRWIYEEFGMKVVTWSVDSQDWKREYRSAELVANSIITNAKPGDIILAHDTRAHTVDAVPKTLDALLAKGFKFASVSELLAMDEGSAVVPHQ